MPSCKGCFVAQGGLRLAPTSMCSHTSLSVFPLVCTSRFGWTLGVEGMWLSLTAGMFFGSIVSFVNICKINWKDMADAARVRTS
ncbi:hypothetical protein KXD40_000333 [Peronospora effusa]|uniref:Uncharacterized protein n=1 Tax=Peronospora effusa TaxID=542832 RepID=A0A3M6VUG5_9STRA|nr:hypothetical protein DD238_000362 [Peronospora effusa]UIZ20453.1 hypothetical protein KXD40_000333 [Peronospora effusa]CAI5702001.1 unnamed protein product [Peronospora effusa]